ncbi:MAG TPA: hypothetical protein VF989_01285 [Polyangiaceae bacterium]
MQPQGTPAAATSTSTAPSVIVERPPPGLARGVVAWPAEAVIVAGSLACALGAATWLWMLRRRAHPRRATPDGARRK